MINILLMILSIAIIPVSTLAVFYFGGITIKSINDKEINETVPLGTRASLMSACAITTLINAGIIVMAIRFLLTMISM